MSHIRLLRRQPFHCYKQVMAELEIKKYVTGMFQQNTWLLSDGETSLLFDCGDDITATLKSEGITPTALLLTHCHLDHIWDLPKFQTGFPDVPVHVHEADLELLEALPEQSQMFGMPLELDAPARPTNLVSDGQTLNFGQIEVKVVHVDGHTEGGVCYIVDNSHCFSGDMLFAGGVGRTDLPGGNPQEMRESLRRMMHFDSELSVYSGHGPVTSIGQENATNPYLQGI